MDQGRLFRLAPEALAINAYYEGPRGWTLTIRMRRQGELWTDSLSEQYSGLSTSELADVIDASTCKALGIG
jgi:hypothetical protein